MARASCHGSGQIELKEGTSKVLLVGSPNVGKSVVFNRLSGVYATVSNYPGTTVEVSRAQASVDGHEYELLDTPGMYSLVPITEEERVARTFLLNHKPAAVIQVVAAQDLERTLPLTFQLIEAGLPLILCLNMMDEAEEKGIRFDIERLEAELGVPAVSTVATTGRGIANLKRRLAQCLEKDAQNTDL